MIISFLSGEDDDDDDDDTIPSLPPWPYPSK